MGDLSSVTISLMFAAPVCIRYNEGVCKYKCRK